MPEPIAMATTPTPFSDPMRVFGHVRARDVRSLASPVLEVLVPAGTVLVREGEEVGTFFVIRAGNAEMSRHGRVQRTIDIGDCFGESDPAAPEPQPYTVTASSELKLLAFSSLGIARLCAAIPGARENILRYLPAPASGASARALAERSRVEHGDRAVVGGDPSELAHQSQRSRDGLPRGARPAGKLVLSNR